MRTQTNIRIFDRFLIRLVNKIKISQDDVQLLKSQTDGPYVEVKEMVGGYLICTTETIEEAVEF